MTDRTYADGRTYTEREIAQRRWRQMVYRCTDPNHPAWKYYGARGIKVCPEWMDFDTFYRDVGELPAGKSLDRINNDGDYEPGNVRWATPKEQRANRRTYTRCHNGHLFTPETAYTNPNSGYRSCRICKMAWQRASRAAHKMSLTAPAVQGK